MGLYRMRSAKDDFLNGAAILAHAHGITPNAMTFLGLCFGVAAGAMFSFRQMPLGFTLGLISVFCDVLDGTIARRFQQATLRGRVLDSVCDRVSESAVVLGALASGIINIWGITAMLGSISLLAFRAISFRKSMDTDFVFFGRTERLFFMMLGLLIPVTTASTVCFVMAGVFGFASSLQIAARLSQLRVASG